MTTYRDVDGARREVDEDVVLAVLDAIGPPVEDALLDAVTVAWDAEHPRLHLAPTVAPDALDGVAVELHADHGARAVVPTADCGIEARAGAFDVVLPAPLEPGAYTATLVGGAVDGAQATVLAAPRRLIRPKERRWGVFAPVTGLHDRHGAADLGCLARLAEWAGHAGAGVVATLPLLATFLDEPFDPSPYVPVSRRWWNELYIDLAAVPELADRPRPEAVGTTHVDHRATMAARRRALEDAAARLRGARARAAEQFESARPEVAVYARFRASVELHGPDATRWPEAVRLQHREVDAARERYHRYVQFVLDEQLRALGDGVRARGQVLYLDLPVGTHPAGFDVFGDPDAFAHGATTGAPPDRFFADGQNWGFRPPHPAGARRGGYRDLRTAIARHLEVADVLRLDHVMGLERLWWVPEGADASAGAYVRYPMEEMFAAVCVEATRTGATIVGEDLGTVSPTVERALARHGLVGMYVGQFAVDPAAVPPVANPPRRSVAGLDTHDTATFSGYWTGDDIGDLVDAGLLGAVEADAMRGRRTEERIALAAMLLGRDDGTDPGTDVHTQLAVLHAWLRRLATGPAELVLVTLEDLWLEPDPQNVPGTTSEHRNWSRRLARAIDALDDDVDVSATRRALGPIRGSVRC